MSDPTPDALFEDIKAADVLSKNLILTEDAALMERGAVSAMERGTREFVDGTVERYERLEYYRP